LFLANGADVERRARVHFAINPDAAKLKCVNTDFLHRLFHSCGGRSVSHDGRKSPMQNQLSTATPDVASLLAGGYLMESNPPTNPIDPPDNQGGGGTGTTNPEPEEEESGTGN
jgi:hypothetical protein